MQNYYYLAKSQVKEEQFTGVDTSLDARLFQYKGISASLLMFTTTELQQGAFTWDSLLRSHLFCQLLQGDLEQLCYGLLLFSWFPYTSFQREEREVNGEEMEKQNGDMEVVRLHSLCISVYYQGAWPDFPRPIS